MFSSKLEIGDQCRTCLSTKEPFLSIFEDNLCEIYQELTRLEVTKDDNFSKEICVACVQRLKAVKKFKKLCIKSHQILTEEANEMRKKLEIDENGRDEDSFRISKDSDSEFGAAEESLAEEIIVENEDSSKLLDRNSNLVRISHKEEKISVNLPEKETFLRPNKTASSNQKSSISCPVCSKEISHRNNLDRHLRTHSKFKPFKCDFCSKSFTARDNLSKHVNSQHTKSKTYVCDICAKVFYCSVNLVVHKKTHSADRLFQCNECHRSYKSKMALKAHLLRHSGTRNFVCGTCSGKFFTNSELKSHERLVHQKNIKKVFECQECGMKFVRKSLLETHERGHTGEKPFKCGICEQSFRRKDTLMKHEVSKHSKNSYKT
ncbi:gastrula zinc finger protein XlCGF64.1-like [Culicoides brevitarsis]|uniref:gastrula zinc finger protein XlCGF64.1-like n=1 Tax=Culicoides brevitarsis TaxID=469753 RepID=UPI00307B6FAF